jgi:hypothetical protein
MSEWNLLVLNNNPNPATTCNLCKEYIGHVFAVNTQPLFPLHLHCFCYATPTSQPVTHPGVPQDGTDPRTLISKPGFPPFVPPPPPSPAPGPRDMGAIPGSTPVPH